MEFFLDTANIEEIREINSLGVISGVTTNPSLIAKEKGDLEKTLREIASIVDGPISGEVIGSGYKEMVKEGKMLSKSHKNIVINIPMTYDGLKAVKELTGLGIKTNVTLIFSSSQALLAARAGATYVSPFLGRVDDIGWNGLSLVKEIKEIFTFHNIQTKIIAASIRNPIHVIESARGGADIGTVPPSVIKQLIKHPLTDIGIKKFEEDWKSIK